MFGRPADGHRNRAAANPTAGPDLARRQEILALLANRSQRQLLCRRSLWPAFSQIPERIPAEILGHCSFSWQQYLVLGRRYKRRLLNPDPEQAAPYLFAAGVLAVFAFGDLRPREFGRSFSVTSHYCGPITISAEPPEQIAYGKPWLQLALLFSVCSQQLASPSA